MRVSSNGGPGSKDPGLYTAENMSLSNLVSVAYNLAYYQLSAPDWMAMTRFDIMARVPPGATKEQFREMMQNLLIDRFKLAVHHENREMAKYDLLVGKNGPKLKEAAPSEPPADDGATRPAAPPAPGPPKLDTDGFPVLRGRGGMAVMNGKARMYNPEETMTMLAGFLSGQMGAPVTDATGLAGKYEISLTWVAGTMRAPAGAGDGPVPMPADEEAGPTLIQAIQQLGLRLESKKGPVDVLVVDHMEKLPTEN